MLFFSDSQRFCPYFHVDLFEYLGILNGFTINLIFGRPKCGHDGLVLLRHWFTGGTQCLPRIPIGIIIRLLHVIDRIAT